MSRIPLNLARIKEEDILPSSNEEEKEHLRKQSSAMSLNSEMSAGLMMSMKHRDEALDNKRKAFNEDFD